MKWPDQPTLARQVVDIHAHIFNGRDIPVAGFLTQVIWRDPHTPPDADMVKTAYLTLLKSILLFGTPTARDELAGLAGRVAPATPAELADRDRANLAGGIVRFQDEQARSLSPNASSDADRVLDRLANELGAVSRIAEFETPNARARRLADHLYRRNGMTRLRNARAECAYTYSSSFMQTIVWALLLTRPRFDIAGTMECLYGTPGHIRVFAPALVDMGAWMKTPETVTLIEDQIAVTAAIARKLSTSLLLPFVSFCPLRAVFERDRGLDPLLNVKNAIGSNGFVGIKLYPPMGFKPDNNTYETIDWAAKSPYNAGKRINEELRGLYDWCVNQDVPIMAHANKSMGAGPNTQEYSDPTYWRPVFDDFKTLRVNLAHFGGFDEAAQRALGSRGNWEETLSDMIGDYQGLYFDLGYWTEGAVAHTPQHQHAIDLLRSLLSRNEHITERMMYGSDYAMLGRDPSHPDYTNGVTRALENELLLSKAHIDAIMGGNAIRFLGLDRPGPQLDRVTRFHGSHPLYKELFQKKSL